MFKLLRKITIKELLLLIPIIGFIVLQVWLDLKLPDYMSDMTRILQMDGAVLSDIIDPGLKMLLCALGSFASALVTGYFVAHIAASLSNRIRKETFDNVVDFGMEEIKKFSVSSLIVRTTNDIANVQRFIAMGLQVIIKAPILSIWAVTKIAGKSLQWSSYVGIAVLILLIVVAVIVVFALPKTKIVQKLTDKLNTIMRENITGIRVIKAFNAEAYHQKKFDKANDDYASTNLFISKMMSLLFPTMTLIMSSLTVVIYLSGAYIINEAQMLDKINIFGDMIVFSSYAMQIIMAFLMLVMIVIMYPRSAVSASRISEVLSNSSSIKTGPFKEEQKEIGKLEFKNVSFMYPDAEEKVIDNISFSINKGETLAIIGGTASGKSSLINLIPRFYDVTEGEILINGVNIKNFDLDYLYSKLGYVPQKSVIFKGSVKSNVSYGSDNISKKLIEEAIEIAEAKEFVNKLDKGINSKIASRGTNISGGQKQRLAIARAVARKPEFFIFDDSFSALDYKTDSNLRKNLKKYTKDATTIIVGQRIGTIMNADKILVIDEGKLVGSGTHQELLKKCKIYKEIAESQLSEKELENE